MDENTIKDMALLFQMRERFCKDCMASSYYCDNCIITIFSKEIETKLEGVSENE